ncbi:MAG: cytochrome c biogenesis protein CcdA [Candidatus Cloacimonetes bacterium]|nr:cytochrome C biogenesis protein [Candidatus Cloacimonadota bacterium]MCK9334983.1 cytochrome C biogenesis protein [Candidatus Cloacimonadota bacterium]MDD2544544.1 cytochrome c biogenesis protein CcdA [Candidatus Cloacimonadota bacterium]MDD2683593.1 cytochrome c biogenesis protein CcdA [Candidatus Cloacimonadota bacterium]MDD3097784.1 cytochrome c biogenesis protein CcdA [Candidatus Cloacimonadota bacterium]
MIMQIFNQLSQALASNPAIALLASFVWGMLSVLLSPCHLASIPMIVGYLDGQKDLSTKKAFRLSAFFTLGILAMMAIIGLITGLLGKILGDVGSWTEPVMGIVFMIMAFFIADVLKMPSFLSGGAGKASRKGIWGALSLGFLLGIALGPCSFAFMAPILGIVFTSAGSQFIFALTLVLAYIIGHCLVIILAGTFAGSVQSYLKWSSNSKGTKIVKIVCAILVFVAGLYLILKKYM